MLTGHSGTHLDAVRVERGEEDELVLPVVSGVPHDVVQGDPAQDCQLEILSRTSPSVNSIHEDVKLVEDPEGRSHRVPECQNQRDARTDQIRKQKSKLKLHLE